MSSRANGGALELRRNCEMTASTVGCFGLKAEYLEPWEV
jgi:hypothetical protein